MSAGNEPATPRAEPFTCPKRMTYGPCGGVREDLTCEMAPHRCAFVDAPPRQWEGPEPGAAAVSGADLLGVGGAGSLVLTDFTVRPYDRENLIQVAELLRGSCDGVLVGEHHNRPDFPPSLMARMLVDAGLSPWITLTCRDRNRVVLEQEARGLALAGAAGVLCVTGDGRAFGTRPDVTQVFDVDSTRLVSLVTGAGVLTAVAESPDAPPRSHRAHRLLAKQAAGARLCILNHVSSVASLTGFAAQARDLGVTLPLVASVAVYTDDRSARVLDAFPGLALDPHAVARVLGARDPVTAGIAAAVEEARALLEVEGVVGVNLSGLASARGELHGAQVKAEVGHAVRAAA